MNIILAAYSYIAAIVGAGFASGQEILSFFVVYGKSGLLGIFLSCIIFSVYAYVIIEGGRACSSSDYSSFLKNTAPKGFDKIFSAITLVFLCGVYSAMLACIGEMTRLLFGIDPMWGRLILSFICCILIISGKEASLRTNAILGVIIAVGIISSAIYMLRYREHQTFFTTLRSGASALAYSGYNLLGAGVVLVGFADKIKSKAESAAVGIVSGCTLFVMMLLVWALLSLYYRYISLGEIPMLTMALRQNTFVAYVYSVMLVLAILTTAVASGTGICDMTKNKIPSTKCAILVMCCGMCISSAGFSHIINVVYRICGYIGIVINLLIVFICIKRNREKERNKEINRALKTK